MWWLGAPRKQDRNCQGPGSGMASFPLCFLGLRSITFKGWNATPQYKNLQPSLIYHNVQIILVRILFCPKLLFHIYSENSPIILSERFYWVIHKSDIFFQHFVPFQTHANALIKEYAPILSHKSSMKTWNNHSSSLTTIYDFRIDWLARNKISRLDILYAYS